MACLWSPKAFYNLFEVVICLNAIGGDVAEHILTDRDSYFGLLFVNVSNTTVLVLIPGNIVAVFLALSTALSVP
jgi:hypothetical protein